MTGGPARARRREPGGWDVTRRADAGAHDVAAAVAESPPPRLESLGPTVLRVVSGVPRPLFGSVSPERVAPAGASGSVSRTPSWGPGNSITYHGTTYTFGSGADDSGPTRTVCWGLGPDDAVFGGGAGSQAVDLRGRRRSGRNVNVHGAAGIADSYLNVPFYWSDAGWGVLIDTGASVEADLGCTEADTAELTVPGTTLDAYLLAGNAAEILRSYVRLCGLPRRPPDWALGVWTSRCSYFDERELLRIVEGYAAAACPLDVVHVDAWQTGDVWQDLSCRWEVDRSRWPPDWSGRIRERGVRVSLWLNPYVRRGTEAGDHLVDAGLVLRDAHGAPAATADMPDRLLVDLFSAEGRRWWRDAVADLVRTEDPDALKADFGEEVPEEALLADGRPGRLVANEYSLRYLAETRAAVDGTDRDRVLLSRSGTAGAQAYAVHWAGDSPSTWGGLRAAVRSCLTLSLSGFAFVGSDIGGFWTPDALERATRAFRARDSALFAADVDPELFARWAQFGALSGVMRFHGVGVREPWAYPPPYGAAAVAACRVRRRLLPYLAAAAQEAEVAGHPLMRPMPLAFPEAREATDALQYLLGPRLLVAPVLLPGGRLRIWVPPGRWTGARGAPDLEGPGWRVLTLALAAMPAWWAESADGGSVALDDA